MEATRAAMDVDSQKAGYKLASKLVRLLFTDKELAASCGQGIRKIRYSSYFRQPTSRSSQRSVSSSILKNQYSTKNTLCLSHVTEGLPNINDKCNCCNHHAFLHESGRGCTVRGDKIGFNNWNLSFTTRRQY
ncbi:hypothetical protein DPMN_114250 [Dreissena polymorpha]|uniref:Uncharacterized protein n=1 Tax=Dreissena polymorpha TaxID=45954 RepID=A0A9D4QRJ4_DREPO|nr:hypothetical protein DPMN_114250 [Dreissena polymorpha]